MLLDTVSKTFLKLDIVICIKSASHAQFPDFLLFGGHVGVTGSFSNLQQVALRWSYCHNYFF